MKVIVGMSGGVDSATAAALLRDGGYEVEGLSLLMFETRGPRGPRACCTMAALQDAGRAAAAMGIPHSVLDARDIFIDKVVEPFVEAYCRGLTPNPCILCNRRVKFPLLMEEAARRGADFIATGHYARVERLAGRTVVKAGVDPSKDQSYVLYALRQGELERLLLPLGGLRKAEVRERARKLGLPVFGRPESQEICFVPGRDYAGLVRGLRPGACRPGPVLDQGGREVGRHEGICGYTVGQRKGLGVRSLTPLYVTAIDPERNAVTVGPREAAMRTGIRVGELNWLAPRPPDDFRAGVKVRSMMRPEEASIALSAGGEEAVTFDRPVFAPAPGQAAVFYLGDTVAGGGVILG